MDNKQVKIKDVITTEYGDFLSYCETSEKVFIEELTNVDFIAFRTISGQPREYVQTIKKKLEEMKIPPKISDTVSKVDSEKNPSILAVRNISRNCFADTLCIFDSHELP